jgi:hypothetical protein
MTRARSTASCPHLPGAVSRQPTWAAEDRVARPSQRRFDWQPGTGRLCATEQGPTGFDGDDGWDEVPGGSSIATATYSGAVAIRSSTRWARPRAVNAMSPPPATSCPRRRRTAPAEME